MDADELGSNDAAQHNPPSAVPDMIPGAPWNAPFLDPEYGNPQSPFPFEGWLAWHFACYLRQPVESQDPVRPHGAVDDRPEHGS